MQIDFFSLILLNFQNYQLGQAALKTGSQTNVRISYLHAPVRVTIINFAKLLSWYLHYTIVVFMHVIESVVS